MPPRTRNGLKTEYSGKELHDHLAKGIANGGNDPVYQAMAEGYGKDYAAQKATLEKKFHGHVPSGIIAPDAEQYISGRIATAAREAGTDGNVPSGIKKLEGDLAPGQKEQKEKTESGPAGGGCRQTLPGCGPAISGVCR